MPPSDNALPRGRTAAPKPLDPPKPGTTTSGTSKKQPAKPTPAPPSTATSSKSAVKSSGSVKGKAPSQTSEFEDGPLVVTKLSSTTVTLPAVRTPKSIPPPPPPKATPAQDEQKLTSDPLQIASQVYPWTYMSSTLDACFKSAETQAKTDLENLSKQLDEEESEIAEQRDRVEAERLIEFSDELGSNKFAKDAPTIMQKFHEHGDSCASIETAALKLAMNESAAAEEDDPLKAYNDMLGDLEKLQNDATELQESITRLTTSDDTTIRGDDVSSAKSQIMGIFAACLPVLRARISNLTMAQELVDSALENISLGLRMESMGLVN